MLKCSRSSHLNTGPRNKGIFIFKFIGFDRCDFLICAQTGLESRVNSGAIQLQADECNLLPNWEGQRDVWGFSKNQVKTISQKQQP